MYIKKTCGELWSCSEIYIYSYKIYVNTFIRYWASGSIEKGETVVDEGMYQIGEIWYNLYSEVLVAEVKCQGGGLVTEWGSGVSQFNVNRKFSGGISSLIIMSCWWKTWK